MQLSTFDLVIVFGYAIALIAIATLVSRERAGHQKDSSDFFLAGKALPWWAVGASLIAANISAEQIIGMSGSGYVVGLAIATYEWLAAVTLIVVGKFFLPVFLKNEIYTMPQFLERRYDGRVKTVMSIFWLALYTFVNLTAILWLGATAINALTGFDITFALIVLAGFAVAYSIYGGLKAVALTDIIQVAMLVGGGCLITWIALNEVSDGAGVIAGMGVLIDEAPGKFDMILDSDHPEYMNLPGIGVLMIGMWVMHFSYWGFNQYIIQRALGAKSVDEAQRGIVFAAFLKLFMPLIIVVPGIAAFVLAQDATSGIEVGRPDAAYPALMALTPVGIRGLIFAALIAAIVSSLGSMMNSISTIFTLDIYKPMRDSASEGHLVTVGRLVSICAVIIAVAVAQPLLGNFPQAFQFIQEFTGFFTPGIVALFVLGVFWKSATANGALAAAIGSFGLSVLGKLYLDWMPFLDRVGWIFLACLGIMFAMAMIERKDQGEKAVSIDGVSFSTSSLYNLGALVVVVTLGLLYWAFW
ncbi:MAG: sodium/sugar symporter [Maricaulis sp.]|uniref:sodium/sugar symporter n=1 Tax=Maricaulis sp. TaxID=1486257 RepID=UPI001B1DF694|nr:sodium/sugar symporter [Maricaulis sp.]MBO6847042.1 sodium/sugar symporter [Maricaulis sp.]MBO6876401.1 sodium/sugar symporter [Maricaulis sp.]